MRLMGAEKDAGGRPGAAAVRVAPARGEPPLAGTVTCTLPAPFVGPLRPRPEVERAASFWGTGSGADPRTSAAVPVAALAGAPSPPLGSLGPGPLSVPCPTPTPAHLREVPISTFSPRSLAPLTPPPSPSEREWGPPLTLASRRPGRRPLWGVLGAPGGTAGSVEGFSGWGEKGQALARPLFLGRGGEGRFSRETRGVEIPRSSAPGPRSLLLPATYPLPPSQPSVPLGGAATNRLQLAAAPASPLPKRPRPGDAGREDMPPQGGRDPRLRPPLGPTPSGQGRGRGGDPLLQPRGSVAPRSGGTGLSQGRGLEMRPRRAGRGCRGRAWGPPRSQSPTPSQPQPRSAACRAVGGAQPGRPSPLHLL